MFCEETYRSLQKQLSSQVWSGVPTDRAPTDRQRVMGELRDLRARREQEEAAYEADEKALVLRARRLELSWEHIASRLGRTRSALWKKYHEAERR